MHLLFILRLVFLLGMVTNITQQKFVFNEALQYRDIVQGIGAIYNIIIHQYITLH